MIAGWSWLAAEILDEKSAPPINAKSIKAEASLILFPKIPPPDFFHRVS